MCAEGDTYEGDALRTVIANRGQPHLFYGPLESILYLLCRKLEEAVLELRVLQNTCTVWYHVQII